jgi:transposase-like protein
LKCAVLDGAKGLSAAVRDVFGETVPIQRCQWHQRENVVSYLPKTQQGLWRRKLQAAYAKATYSEAQRALRQLGRELEQHNASAARSLEEGLEETLTLHRLEVFMKLGISFKTTNLIESVMARVEAKTRRITRWRTSDQKQRWCAATLLEIEKQFRKVKGHQHLGLLQAALRGKLSSPPAAA